jgi:CspA family cold shock protein
MEKIRGVVKWFSIDRRYGFATRTDGGGDVFLHFCRLLDDPEAMVRGAEICFGVMKSEKGPIATDVELVKNSEVSGNV